MVKRIVFSTLFVTFLSACSSSNSKPLLIGFSKDQTKIELNNVDKAGLWQLRQLEHSDSLWKELVVVLQSPSEAEPSIREEPFEGKVLLTDSNVVFIPSRPFVKGRQYLVITHLNARFGGAGDVLTGKLAAGLKPTQKLLTR